MTTTTDFPANVDPTTAWVTHDGHGVCGGCAHDNVMNRTGWDTRWNAADVFAAHGFDNVTGTGEGHCSWCDRDVR